MAEIHSDLDQKSREQYLQDFRNQKINILHNIITNRNKRKHICDKFISIFYVLFFEYFHVINYFISFNLRYVIQ